MKTIVVLFIYFSGGNERSKSQPTGPSEEDGHVEASLTASNKVYEVHSDSLVPVDNFWGQIPKYELLSSDKVIQIVIKNLKIH